MTLPNSKAPATECVTRRKNRRLCPSGLEIESINTSSDDYRILYKKITIKILECIQKI